MIYQNLDTFREDMLAGYAAAFPEYIMEVPGGVARVTETPKGKIAVINGGGSGHYPAFCGIVGTGMMDATVVGNIFSSPSSDDVYHVAKAVENGSGVFIVGGNYAGDKMNFNAARDRLLAEGISARTFYITDDIASASPEEKEKRRGNVGTLIVFKAAGAAAAEGASFDEVERLTKKANDMTRTISIGFQGCRMPGSRTPMFSVPEGKMEVGQGIHGEPGIMECDLKSVPEIAELLTERLVNELPEGSKRIAVILDGLGSTKYEELFVMWKHISSILKNKGYTLVDPQVGELVTSLDMEGVALSAAVLDEELERLWTAPADTPAFRKGTVKKETVAARQLKADEVEDHYADASDASREAAAKAVEKLELVKAALMKAEPELARIDAIAGDGDHGRGMVKGITFACEAADHAVKAGAGFGSTLIAAGKAWASKAGGTSGILWGAGFETVGVMIGDEKAELSAAEAAAALKAVADKIQEMGGAKPGDKTMLDTLIPFAGALADHSDLSLAEAWKAASKVADAAADATANLLPKIGRARPQAERSLGTPDPGAVSMALCIRTVVTE